MILEIKMKRSDRLPENLIGTVTTGQSETYFNINNQISNIGMKIFSLIFNKLDDNLKNNYYLVIQSTIKCIYLCIIK